MMSRSEASRPAHRGRLAWVNTGLVVLGAGVIAMASRLEVPMVPVPMTMQSYAVLVVAAMLGWRLGAAAVFAYLAAAAAGVPVLAGGGSGLDRLMGPTAGYLAGFLAAAMVVGWLAQRGWRSAGMARSLAAMLLGHALILGPGTLWLALQLGWPDAVAAGFSPFIAGAAVKSLLAAVTVAAVRRAGWRRGHAASAGPRTPGSATGRAPASRE